MSKTGGIVISCKTIRAQYGFVTRPISLYTATSLDGFTARSDDRLDSLGAIPNPDQLNYGYSTFLASVDTTLIGHTTYQTILGFGGDFPYPDKTNYVFSRPARSDAPFVHHVAEAPDEFVQRLKLTQGSGIWLIGGGQLNTVLLNAGLIDELIISTAPIVLGTGIPLFDQTAIETGWVLTKTESFNTGFVQSTYKLAHAGART